MRGKKTRSWSVYKKRKQQRAPFFIAGGILFLLTVGSVYWFAYRDTPKSSTPHDTAANTKASDPPYTKVTGRYLFNGTIAWSRALETSSKNDINWLFSKLDTFDRTKYDAWIADLECPVSTKVVPYQTQVDALIFNCPPQFIEPAKKYFDIVNLANNHSGDLSRETFYETQKHLNDAGMQSYGDYDMTVEENRCEVVAMPVRLEKKSGDPDQAMIPIAYCAYHAVSRSPTAAELATITKYAKVMPVFAFVHMGVEYTSEATEIQKQVGRDAVDAGAEFVIMNHPHWVQGTEVYKGKLIAHSTGNFFYDQLTFEELRSASIDVALSLPYDENMAAWLAYAKTCNPKALHDACFVSAPQTLTRLKPTYLFDMVAGDARAPFRWQARKADEQLQLDTEARTNWTQSLQQLNQTQRLH